MDTFGDFDDMTSGSLGAAVGIGYGMTISATLWIAIVDVWLLVH